MWTYVLVGTLIMMKSVECDTILTMVENARSEALKNYPSNTFRYGFPKSHLMIYPLSISHLDETTQTFSFTANFIFLWTDPFLSLNVTTVEHHHDIIVTYSAMEIGTPVLAVMNSALGNVFVKANEHDALSAQISGFTTMEIVRKLQTSCDVDLTRFPFDEQKCKVVMREYVGEFDISVFDELLVHYKGGHKEWQLLNISTENPIPGEHVMVFHMRRESSFYVTGIMFPIILLSFLNSFVFLLPADTGDKISFLVSIFVSYAVFVSFINEKIPKTNRMPRLVLYLVFVQCHSTLCILTTLCILNFKHYIQDQQKFDVSDPPRQENANRMTHPSTDVSEKHPGRKTCGRIRSFKTVERVLFLLFFAISALMTMTFVL